MSNRTLFDERSTNVRERSRSLARIGAAACLLAASGAALAHGVPDDAVMRTPPPRLVLPEKAKPAVPAPAGRSDRASTVIGVALLVGGAWLAYEHRAAGRETAVQVDAEPRAAAVRVTWRF